MFGSKSIGLLLPLFFSSTVNGLRIPFTRNFRYMSTISSEQNSETVIAASEPTAFQSVFVGNLPIDMSEDDLKSLFDRKVGETVKNVRFAADKRTGRFRGFAHLDFADSTDAQAAIASLNGILVSERAIVANISEDRKKAEPRTRGAPAGGTPQENSVYIGNLDYDAKENDLLAICNAKVGEGKVTKVRIAVDRESGSSKGFAFIDFANPEFAAEAISSLNNAQVLGKEIKVASAIRKDDFPQRERGQVGDRRAFAAPEHTIFLGNLNWDMTAELIEEMVNDVVGTGLIQKVRVAVDRETGRPRGFAHIDFKDAESAQKAVNDLNGMEVFGRSLRVDHAAGGNASGGAPRSSGGDRGSFGGDRRGAGRGDFGGDRRGGGGGRGGGGDRRGGGGDRYNENRGRSGGEGGGDYGSW